jgi:hypothetical protein
MTRSIAKRIVKKKLSVSADLERERKMNKLKSIDSLLPVGFENVKPKQTMQQFFKEWVHYDPTTGELTRLKSPFKAHLIGKPLTISLFKNIYIAKIGGKNYNILKLIWCYMTGSYFRGHKDMVITINGDKNDLRFKNIQHMTTSEYWHKRKIAESYFNEKTSKSNKFQARIIVNKKYTHLGSFDTAKEARIAYMKAKLNVRNNVNLMVA